MIGPEAGIVLVWFASGSTALERFTECENQKTYRRLSRRTMLVEIYIREDSTIEGACGERSFSMT